MASDERAVYGLLADGGRFLYTTYDSPAESFLFDLNLDPHAQHNLLTGPLQEEYAQQIIRASAYSGRFLWISAGSGIVAGGYSLGLREKANRKVRRGLRKGRKGKARETRDFLCELCGVLCVLCG